MSDRWYAARRGAQPGRKPLRLRSQPTGGFADVGGVMQWLVEQGHLKRVDDPEGTFYKGWGDPFCAVAASRNDPWEPVPQLDLIDGGAT